jgi:hypothetical protein
LESGVACLQNRKNDPALLAAQLLNDGVELPHAAAPVLKLTPGAAVLIVTVVATAAGRLGLVEEFLHLFAPLRHDGLQLGHHVRIRRGSLDRRRLVFDLGGSEMC